MKVIFSVLGLFIYSFCWTQDASISDKLEKMSKEFNIMEITDEGNITHSSYFNYKNDTLIVINSKGFTNQKKFTNIIYIIPIKEVALFEYVEAKSEIKRYSDLKIKTKNDLPTLLQITELSETPLKHMVLDDNYIYDANYKIKIGLPLINNTSLYKDLETILMSLID